MPVDVGRELIELIEPPLGSAPVERLAPVGDELLEIRQVRAVIPVRAGDLTGKARARQALLQIGKNRIFDMDLERDDRFLAPGQGRLDRTSSSTKAERLNIELWIG